jgi:hypothetical membrane protein
VVVMFGLGWQELLILLILAGLIVGLVLAANRRKLVHVAACLGFLQGLANVAFGVLGGPPGYMAQDRFQASVAVVWMLAQGVAMIIFAIATYRRKLYGAYGLLVIALLYAVLSLVEKGTPGWIIPPLIYLFAIGSLHRARRTPQAAQPL